MTTPREYVAVPGDARRAAKAALSRLYRSRSFVACMLAPALLVLLGLVLRTPWAVPVGLFMAWLVWLPLRQRTVARLRSAYAPGARWRVTVSEDQLQVSSALSESTYSWADFSVLTVIGGFVVLDHRVNRLHHVLPAALFGEHGLRLARDGIEGQRRPTRTGPSAPPARSAAVPAEFRGELAKVARRQILRSPLVVFGFIFLAVIGVWWTLAGAWVLVPLVLLLALGLVWASSKGGSRLVAATYPPGSTMGLTLESESLAMVDPRGTEVSIPLSRVASVEVGPHVVLVILRERGLQLPLPRELLSDEEVARLVSVARQ